jgi:hypothetical protein
VRRLEGESVEQPHLRAESLGGAVTDLTTIARHHKITMENKSNLAAPNVADANNI